MEYFSTVNPKKSPALVLIHGWGGSWQSWLPIIERLKNDFDIFAFDLPGFGNQNITKSLTLEDYVNFVIQTLKKRHIKNPILIGHSFGGAIISQIAAQKLIPIKKLILIDAATIRHPYTRSQKAKFKILGVLKKAFPFSQKLYYRLTNQLKSDYAVLANNPLLQKTFRNVIQQDLSSVIHKINIPTLIIWGEDDLETPLTDGQKINSLIPQSQMIVYPHSSHFSYLENQNTFVDDIKKFIKK